MIVKTRFVPMFILDIGRPNLIDDVDYEYWNSIHQLIESWPQPILVNGAYDFICDMLKSKNGYMGGGMAYSFGFTTEEDKEAFLKAVKELPRFHKEK